MSSTIFSWLSTTFFILLYVIENIGVAALAGDVAVFKNRESAKLLCLLGHFVKINIFYLNVMQEVCLDLIYGMLLV